MVRRHDLPEIAERDVWYSTYRFLNISIQEGWPKFPPRTPLSQYLFQLYPLFITWAIVKEKHEHTCGLLLAIVEYALHPPGAQAVWWLSHKSGCHHYPCVALDACLRELCRWQEQAGTWAEECLDHTDMQRVGEGRDNSAIQPHRSLKGRWSTREGTNHVLLHYAQNWSMTYHSKTRWPTLTSCLCSLVSDLNNVMQYYPICCTMHQPSMT